MHTDISLFCWKLHRGLKAEKVHLCVFTCASLSHRAAVAFTFDLPWRRISLSLLLSVNVSPSQRWVFWLSHSKMVCQAEGHLFVVLIMNKQFPPGGGWQAPSGCSRCVDAYLSVWESAFINAENQRDVGTLFFFFFVFCVCTFVQLCAHEDIVTLSRIRVSFIFFSLYLLRNNFASNIYIIRSGHTPIQDLHWHINTDSNKKKLHALVVHFR